MNAQTINNDNFVSVVPRILDPGMKFTKESLSVNEPKLPEVKNAEPVNSTVHENLPTKKINFFVEHKYAIIMVLVTIVIILLMFVAYKYFYEKKNKENETITVEQKTVVDDAENKRARDEYLANFIIDDYSKEEEEPEAENTIDPIIVEKPIIISEKADLPIPGKLSTENIEVLLSTNNTTVDNDDVISIGEYNKKEDSPKYLTELHTGGRDSNIVNKISLDEMKQVDDSIFIKSNESSQKTDSSSSGEMITNEESDKSDDENYDNLHSDNSDDDIDCFKRFTKR